MKKKFLKSLLRKQYFIAAIAFFLLFLIAVTGEIKSREKQEINRWVNHTIGVLNILEEVKLTLYELSNIQKTYVITDKADFIQSFGKYSEKMENIQTQLAKETIDNRSQQDNIGHANTLIKEIINYYDSTMMMVQNGQKNKAIKVISSGRGVELLSNVISHIEKMKLLEEKLLKERMEKEREINQTLNLLVVIGIIGGMITLIVFLYHSFKQTIQKDAIQHELNRSVQIQKAIFDASAFALIASDKFGVLNFVNPAAEKLLGYGPNELIGQKVSLFHDPYEMIKMAEVLSKRFDRKFYPDFEVFTYRADHDMIESDQWSYIRKNGDRIQVKLSVTPIKDPDGNTTGYLGVAFDMTKQIEFETTLQIAKEEALHATHAKSEFLANMSHEIRTPMNAIMGMAELLHETNLDEEQKNYVRIFKNAGTSLLAIINDILDISKIEANHLELQQNSFSIRQVIEGVAETISVKAHQKHLELVIDIEESLYDSYLGDALRIRQILINLIGNSIKFTRSGEVILRAYSSESGLLHFEVEDTGIGMTQKQMNSLFKRFSQADTSITKEFGGTGLGLSITKQLVEMMNGKIEVESSLGVGSIFKFYLKLTPVEAQKVKMPEIDDLELKGREFLIVDDNQTNRMLLKNILEKQGAIITEAENGDEAWKIFEKRIQDNEKKSPYDLILIDGHMPGMDGFGLAQKIIDSQVNDPLLLMLTSDNRPGDIARSKEIGVHSLLVKPILKEVLLEAIKRALVSVNTSFVSVEKDQTLFEEIQSNKQQEKNNKKRILLVDDNEDNLQVARAFLRDQSYEIVEARNGKEAVKIFDHQIFDIVLMDMNMPVMDGYAATSEMRKKEREEERGFTPVIALSAYAHTEEIQKSLQAGCNSHLTKPYSKKDLINLINLVTSKIEIIPNDEVADLLPRYLKSREDEVRNLLSLVQNQEFSALEKAAHKIAGSAGSYGLDGLTPMARQIEERAREQDMLGLQIALGQYQLYLKRVKLGA